MAKTTQSAKGKAGKSTIVPLGDRVLLSPLEKKSGGTTDSGIYLPESVREDRQGKVATVVAVGEGRLEDGQRIKVSVEVGDTVLYSWGDTITHEGKDYVIVREAEIMAIINS